LRYFAKGGLGDEGAGVGREGDGAGDGAVGADGEADDDDALLAGEDGGAGIFGWGLSAFALAKG